MKRGQKLKEEKLEGTLQTDLTGQEVERTLSHDIIHFSFVYSHVGEMTE